MNFSEIRASVRRHWPVAVLILALIPVVMGIYLVQRDVVRPPARYTTSADVLIPARDEANDAPEGVPPVLLQGQVELALDPDTTDRALDDAEVAADEADDVEFMARQSEDRTTMTLSVEAPDPDTAATVLDRYIVSYQNGRRESVLDAADELREIQVVVIDSLTERQREVERQLAFRSVGLPPRVPDGDPVAVPAGASIDTALLLYERNAVLNEIQRREVGYSLSATQATAPGTYSTVVQRRSTARITPPPPSPLIPLLEILGVGLVLAVLIPVIMDKADPTITEARAVPGALRSGVLGTIPHVPRRLQRTLAPPGSAWELAFRSLAATSIATDRLPQALMVTSPSEETQDVVAANFAAALADLGVTVALIATVPRQSWFLHDEVDESEPRTLPAVTGGTGGVGATSGAAGTAAPARIATFPELIRDAEAGRLNGDLRGRLGRRSLDGLYIVPPGTDDNEISLDGLPPLLQALTQSSIDVAVIAGPALLEDPSATIMAWSTRHVLWAVEVGRVNKNSAHLAADRLDLAGVEPFGIAVVNRSAIRT